MRFIPAVSPVQIQVPLPHAGETPAVSPVPDRVKCGPLVKWLRHGPFTAVTWVRVPYGSPLIGKPARACQYGGLAQLVRAPASHAGGHWFESSSLHQNPWKPCVSKGFCYSPQLFAKASDLLPARGYFWKSGGHSNAENQDGQANRPSRSSFSWNRSQFFAKRSCFFHSKQL